MNYRAVSILSLLMCLLLLVLASPGLGVEADAGSAGVDQLNGEVNDLITAETPPASIMPSKPDSTRSCLPRYGEQQFILRVTDSAPYEYEPGLTAADFNGDGLEDVVITKMTFQSTETYKLDILLNDGKGSLKLATSSLFGGTVPAVQNPRQVVTADFNGDDIADIFVADHGYDVSPHPGYQNQLVLSAPNGRLEDATSNLPQQNDFSHSACAADIDDDDDIDLYNGNIWGLNMIDPQILLNDGKGKFTIGKNRLPPLTSLNQNGYTTCAFGDVNKDGSPDLILGDAGDDIGNEHSTPISEVLLNNGSGIFTHLPDAMPQKLVSSADIAHDIQPLNLNSDGYIDLLIVYEGWTGPLWQGSYIQALVNNKDGTFRDETATRLEALDRRVWIPSLELRDLDHDGDLDLLAFPWDDQDPDPLLFLNDGAGHFRQRPLKFGLTYLNYTFLDLDGDDGHDMVMATFAPPEDVYVIRDLGCPAFLPFICRK